MIVRARVEDVAVLGGGPAGAATALTLARTGISTVLIDAANEADTTLWKIGEGLPPLARLTLQRLGVWERFATDGHLPSHGNCSAWGTSQLAERNFLFEPYGHGWHLDRQRFDALLRAAAVATGARYCAARVSDCRFTPTNEWCLELMQETTVEQDGILFHLAGNKIPTCSTAQVTARFVVDATGRASWFARKQGAHRLNSDGLVGVAALLAPAAQGTDRDSLTMIEAVEDGWWYAALLASGRLVMVFLSDGDLPAAKAARTGAGWLQLLSRTEHLARRVVAHGYCLAHEPRIVSANSSRLDQVAGTHWLAVGDAAAAYDPLSSQGILAALESGERAGAALMAKLQGQTEALAGYARSVDEHWQHYLASLRFYYGQETRWPDAPFWQRRVAQT